MFRGGRAAGGRFARAPLPAKARASAARGRVWSTCPPKVSSEGVNCFRGRRPGASAGTQAIRSASSSRRCTDRPLVATKDRAEKFIRQDKLNQQRGAVARV